MSPTINTIGRFTDAVKQKEKAYNLNCSELETGDDVQWEITANIFHVEPLREVIMLRFVFRKKDCLIFYFSEKFSRQIIRQMLYPGNVFFLGVN